MSQPFSFTMASWIPFQDEAVLARMRQLTRDELTQHANPDFKIRILDNVEGVMIADMIYRIQRSDLEDQKTVMICPNPAPSTYGAVADTINRLRISCRNLHLFAMDEWANEFGEVAPPSWKPGLTYSFSQPFYRENRSKAAHANGPGTLFHDRKHCGLFKDHRSSGRRRSRYMLQRAGLERTFSLH